MEDLSSKGIVALAFLKEVFYGDFAETFTDERFAAVEEAFNQLDLTIKDLEFLQGYSKEIEDYTEELEEEVIDNARLVGETKSKLHKIMNSICDLSELYVNKGEDECSE